MNTYEFCLFIQQCGRAVAARNFTVKGDVDYICKQDGKTTVFKTYDTNYVLPEYAFHTITHKGFTDVLEKRFKQLTPKARF